MKLHLPKSLRANLFACLSFIVGCTLYSGSMASADALSQGRENTLTIDYADPESIMDLENGALQLDGNAKLLLSNCGEGDGRTYTLLNGVSSLLDAEGNVIHLDDSNNAVSHYFDATQPGTGFWADATLSLTEDGTLQLVRHHETMKAAQTITTRQPGTLVYNYYEGISFEDIDYSLTSSIAAGGAIEGSTIELSNNGSVTFSGNTVSATGAQADALGGAICGYSGNTITLSGNGSVEFIGNTASSTATATSTSTSVNAHAYAYGGAICGYSGNTITLSNNGSVTFSGNTVSATSSATSTSTSVNAVACGGAICGVYDNTITLSNNGSVTFSGNTVSATSTATGTTTSRGYADASGGAIDSGTITLSGNGSVEFIGNTASASATSTATGPGTTSSGTTSRGVANACGGAIFGRTITLSGNGSVEFIGNTASASSTVTDGYPTCNAYARGGAIYCDTIELSGNGSVEFIGNTASATAYSFYPTGNTTISYGGAIYSGGSVIITGNDEVTFAQNVEKSGTNYRLRSLYLECDESTDKLTLSAGKGQSISFYDSIYMGENGSVAFNANSVAFNADYTDAEGVIRKASGTILFSGATTEDDLKDAKNGVAGTEEEILNSRTSELKRAATLYGGTLQVQDKAVLKLNRGLTVAKGGNASVEVKAAELNVGSHALSMVSGSSLVLADGAKVTATEVTITTGATLAVRGSVTTTPLTEQVAALTLSEETVAGFDAARAVNTGSVSVLEGDLTLESGSLLSLDDAYLELSGDLFFAVAEGEEKIALDIAPGVITDENNQVVLFNVDGVVTFGFDGLTASADNGMVYCVKAEDYFTGSRVQESTKLVYDSSTGMVYLENAAGTVPEPTTTTLSLLALAALAARRRRK